MRMMFALSALALTLTACGSKDSGTTTPTTGDTTATGAGTGSGTGTGTGAGTGSGTGTGTGAGTGTGTGTGGSTFDLTFTGTGYNPHDSQTVWFVLCDSSNTCGAITTTATDGSGNLSESWTGALTSGESYTLYWAADHDSSTDCSAGDHMWSEAIAAVTANVDITRNHDLTFDNTACDHL